MLANAARRLLFIRSLGGLVVGAACSAAFSSSPSGILESEQPGSISFNKTIAPILFEHCAVCHRPGQSAPFALLTYGDAKKRARQIVEVTERQYMPPWLPEAGYGDFVDIRRLPEKEIALIKQWAAEGAIEGSPSDLPPAPKWPGDWVLGEPDLILDMPAPYSLPAEGKDIFRNFVIPVNVATNRYVKGFEFQPGNPRIVHHAFIKVDRTRQSRKLDGRDGMPGFAGMNVPKGVDMPEGHFLTWQPGRLPAMEPDDFGWVLQTNSDLVVQAHLRPTGRPEILRSRIGLYFKDRPPAKTCAKLGLVAYALDIPPEEQNYLVTQDFVLPVDAQVIGVLPHAHYLCRRMEAFAILPGGERKWLLLINDWDFNWQRDYRYRVPIALPQGTTLSMRYTYDNSTNNVRNPNHPPKRVVFGLQSSDEMAELWLKLLPRNSVDADLLAKTYSAKMQTVVTDYNEFLLRLNPTNAAAHAELGFIRFAQGKTEEALQHLRSSIELDPSSDEPHYTLGLLLRQQKLFVEAKREFQTAIRLNPANYDAHGNLGVIFAEEGKLASAEAEFRAALRINPADARASALLEELLQAKGQR